MVTYRILLATLAILFLVAFPSMSGEKIAVEVYAKGYFVKNKAPLPGNPAYLVLQDKKSFDQIFGFGAVMGAKPKLVDEKLFENSLIVTVIKSGNTLWKYDIEEVRLEKKKLIVNYLAKGAESATAKYTVPLILSVRRGEFTEVVLNENGKDVGEVEVKGK